MKTLKEIRARLAEIKPDIETLGTAEAALTEEDETRLSALIEEWDTLTEAAKPLEERARKVEEIRAAMARPGQAESGDGATGGVQVMRRIEPFEPGDDPTRMTRGEARDKALKALDSRDLNGHLNERQKVQAESLLRQQGRNTDGGHIARRLLVTESEAYRSAFMKLTVQPNPVLTPEEGRAVQQFNEFRAMNITTDADGGYGVPVLIDPTIVLDAQGSSNPFFQISRVETITTDTWKGVSSAGVSWSFDAESAEVSNDQPTLAQPSVAVHKAQGFIPYSIEVGMDYPGFAAEMNGLLASGYSELLVDKFTIGTGSGQPTGITVALDGSASEVDTATTNVLAAADVNGLWAALPERYRANATWMASTVINNAIQQLGSGAEASFTVDFTAEGVSVLKGRKFINNDYVISAFATDVKPFLIVGDFSNFLIAQRAGMSVELVPHLFATANNLPNGQRGLYAWARVGSDSINDKGFRALSDNGS